MVVTQVRGDLAQALARHNLESHLPGRGRQDVAALAVGEGALTVAHPTVGADQTGIDQPKPPLIVARRGECFGGVQVGEQPLVIVIMKRYECWAQGQAYVDRLFERLARVRAVLQRFQRLLIGDDHGPVC
jgi:hypothetical protein